MSPERMLGRTPYYGHCTCRLCGAPPRDRVPARRRAKRRERQRWKREVVGDRAFLYGHEVRS